MKEKHDKPPPKSVFLAQVTAPEGPQSFALVATDMLAAVTRAVQEAGKHFPQGTEVRGIQMIAPLLE